MRLEAWLAAATPGLTPGVQARMRAEYTAHVQDAGLDEAEDVEGLLGKPEEARRSLGRVYLDAATFEGLREPRGQRVGFWILGAYGVLLLLLWAGGNDQVGPPLTGVAIAGSLLALFTLGIRRMGPELRALLQTNLGFWAVNFSFWVSWTTGAWTGEPPLWLIMGFPLMWLCWGAEVTFKSQKLRRTLALEQPAVFA